MFPRIVATEWESCIIAYDEKGKAVERYLRQLGFQRLFMKSIPSPPALRNITHKNENKMPLGNGGLIYLDTGFHFEHASAEGVEAMEALLHHKVGERIFEATVAEANRKLAEGGSNVRLRLFKGNIDIAGNTYGFHENYLIRRNEHTDWSTQGLLRHTVLPFLMSRPLLGGIGWFGRNHASGGIEFHLSQRATKMETVVGNATTNARAILSTRDEPHANQDFWKRLHLICGDALSVEPALFLTLSSTSRVLDMIEEGFCQDQKLPDISGMSELEVVNTMKELNQDPSLRVARRFGEKSYTIVNLQEAYRDMVRRFCESRLAVTEETAAELKPMFNLWDWVIEKAKENHPHEVLSKKLEWAAKLLAVEKYGENQGFDLTMPHHHKLRRRRRGVSGGPENKEEELFDVVKDFDLEFHECVPRSILRILETHGKVERLVTEEAIQKFMEPQLGCRAFFRGRTLKFLDNLAVELGRRIEISDPFWMEITVEIPDTSKFLPPYSTPVPVKFVFNM